MAEPGLGERLDQLDLVRGADRARFDLEPLARAFLVDLHICRQIAHGHPPLARASATDKAALPPHISLTVGHISLISLSQSRPLGVIARLAAQGRSVAFVAPLDKAGWPA